LETLFPEKTGEKTSFYLFSVTFEQEMSESESETGRLRDVGKTRKRRLFTTFLAVLRNLLPDFPGFRAVWENLERTLFPKVFSKLSESTVI